MNTVRIIFLFTLVVLSLVLYPRPSFSEVSKIAGISKAGLSSGISWADFDNNGDDDLLILGGEGPRLFKNLGNGKFEDITPNSGIKPDETSQAGVFADFDNDGCKDLYVSNSQKGKNDFLYRGNCKGFFTDVSVGVGLKDGYNSRGVAWADFDNDGYLDIYIASQGYIENDKYIHEPNILYRNESGKRFVKVTQKAGVSGYANCPEIPSVYKEYAVGGPVKWGYQPIWFDYDNDGKIDLFVATDYGVSVLYKNKGDATFTDVTLKASLCRNGSGMGVTVGDYDSDGFFDLYITNVGANFLLRNKGDGTFEEAGAKMRVADPLSIGWGTEFLDYNNDGLLDIFAVNGTVDKTELIPLLKDKLYKNTEKKFVEVSQKEGVEGEYPKEAGAFSDFDNNGSLDFITISGATQHQGKINLFKGKNSSNNWLKISLKGTISNKDAVGARITVWVKGKKQMRQVTSGSSFISQSSSVSHFGLGKERVVDRIEINWPSSKTTVLENIKANQILNIKEE